MAACFVSLALACVLHLYLHLWKRSLSQAASEDGSVTVQRGTVMSSSGIGHTIQYACRANALTYRRHDSNHSNVRHDY